MIGTVILLAAIAYSWFIVNKAIKNGFDKINNAIKNGSDEINNAMLLKKK